MLRVAVAKRCKNRERHKRACRRRRHRHRRRPRPRRLRLRRLRRRTVGDLRLARLSRAITLQAQVRDVTARTISSEYGDIRGGVRG